MGPIGPIGPKRTWQHNLAALEVRKEALEGLAQAFSLQVCTRTDAERCPLWGRPVFHCTDWSG